MKTVGVTSILGRRTTNEDEHLVFEYKFSPVDLLVCSVFDGHQGKEASQYCASHFENIFTQNMQTFSLDVKQVLKFSLLTLNQSFLNINKVAGCTACVFVFDYASNYVYTANVGDSRCIFRAASVLYEATTDHKPNNEEERDRLEKLGQKVMFAGGVARVNGKLAVSRSIGDAEQKPNGIIADPEIQTYHLSRVFDYCIVACDGLFDVMKNHEIDQLIMKVVYEEDLKIESRYKLSEEVYEAFNNYMECGSLAGDAIMKKKCKKKMLQPQMIEELEEEDTIQTRVAKALARIAFWLGSNDNISIIFIGNNLL